VNTLHITVTASCWVE